jgi:hypothetical protein
MEDGYVITNEDEINLRQQNIVSDYSEKIAIVVGLGGIGSWVAIDLALIGIGTLILFDNDQIESSNLNRTLFKLSQKGEFKTKAVKQLIAERRKNILVITNEELFQAEHLKKYNGIDYFVDASDTTRLKDSLAEIKSKIETPLPATKSKTVTTSSIDEEEVPLRFPLYCKLGYDGFNATMCFNDFTTGQWGEDSSYTVTPSFFGTPQIISAMAVIELLMKRKHVSRTVNMNVKRLINHIEESQNLLKQN